MVSDFPILCVLLFHTRLNSFTIPSVFSLSVSLTLQPLSMFHFFFFKDLIYLFMRDTEAETQAEENVGSLRGPHCGARSQGPRITRLELKADAQPLSHPGTPPDPLLT